MDPGREIQAGSVEDKATERSSDKDSQESKPEAEKVLASGQEGSPNEGPRLSDLQGNLSDPHTNGLGDAKVECTSEQNSSSDTYNEATEGARENAGTASMQHADPSIATATQEEAAPDEGTLDSPHWSANKTFTILNDSVKSTDETEEQEETDVLVRPEVSKPSLSVPEIRIDECSDRSLSDSPEKAGHEALEFSSQDVSDHVQSTVSQSKFSSASDVRSGSLSHEAEESASVENGADGKKAPHAPRSPRRTTTPRVVVSSKERREKGIVIANYFGQGISRMEEIIGPVKVIAAHILATGSVVQTPDGAAATSEGETSSGAIQISSTTTEEPKSVDERAKAVSVEVNVPPLVGKVEERSLLTSTDDGKPQDVMDRPADCNAPAPAPAEAEAACPSPTAQPGTSDPLGKGDKVDRDKPVVIDIERHDCDELCGRFLTRICPSMQAHSKIVAKTCCISSVVVAFAFVGAMIFIHRMTRK